MTIIEDRVATERVAATPLLPCEPQGPRRASTLEDIDCQRVMREAMTKMFEVEVEPVRVGRYEIIRRLGGGTMGQVHEARDHALGRLVALKLLAPERLAELPEDLRIALLREAQSLARLSHPNVVQVYEVGLEQDPVFIAMELVDGKTVARWLAEDQPSWEAIVATFCLAGRGLQAAHEQGMVHRDFKPENVMIRTEAPTRVCVTDFGLARSVPDDPTLQDGEARGSAGPLASGPQTQSSHRWAGTPVYMAPEQLEDVATPSCDQFAFCASLYQALFGVLPFDGDTVAALQLAKRSGPPTPKDMRGVPRWVLRAVSRGLEPNPRDRHPSMRALLAVLDVPRRKHRRNLAAAALGLTTIVVPVTLGIAYASREPTCDRFADAFAESWDADAHRESLAGFERTGAPQAAGIHARVAGAIDERVAEWTALRTATCEAEHAQAESMGQQLAAARAQCLDERGLALQEVIDNLEGVGRAELPWMTMAANDLVPLTPCRGEVPAAPELEGPLAQHLAQAEAYAALGRFADARAEVAKLQEYPRRGGGRWYTAWAGIIDGKAALELDDVRVGEHRLVEAAEEAERAGHDYLAWTAWVSLADLGRRGQPRAELERWIDYAAAAERRIDDSSGAEDRARRLRLLRANADVFAVDEPERQQRGRTELQALAATEGLPYSERTTALQGLLTLAILTQDRAEASVVATRLDESIEGQYLGERPSSMASLHLGEAFLDLGYASMLECRWDDAVVGFLRARAEWAGGIPDNHEYFGRVDAALAQAYMGAGRFADARAQVEHDVEVAEGLGRGAALLALGVVDFGEGALEAAWQHMTEATAIFTAQGRLDLAAIAGLGVVEAELHLGRFAEAEVRLETLREQAASSPGVGLLHKLDGLVALRAGELGQAERSLREALSSLDHCELYELADTELALAATLRAGGQTALAAQAERTAQAQYAQRGDAGAQRRVRMETLLKKLIPVE